MQVSAIYGPPGTGKTTELLRRVKAVRDSGVAPERIAFLSFTRAAASEALSRLGIKKSKNVSTIHALAFRTLGLKQSQVVDPAKLREFSKAVGVPVIGKSPEDDEERSDGDFYLDIINYARSIFAAPSDVYDISDRPGTRAEFEVFSRAYRTWKSTFGYYDFTDMLEKAANQPFRSDAEVVFVDEAQDLSPLQWAVIEKLVRRAHEVHIAGDDDQAIYAWSGADPQGMSKFTDKHNGTSEVLSLSHRLPVSVHERSQSLIRRIAFRVDKTFNSKGHPGVVRLHGSIHSVELEHGRDTLLLGRTHSVLREVEQQLIERRIPYSRESGRPGMWDNKFAAGIRAFKALEKGEILSDSLRTALFNVATAKTRRLLESNDYRAIVGTPFYVALNVPARTVDFFAEADLEATPTIRLSTIHAAKGHEANHVVLLTDQTARVVETSEKNPDDEVRVFYVGMTRTKNELDIVEGYNGYKL